MTTTLRPPVVTEMPTPQQLHDLAQRVSALEFRLSYLAAAMQIVVPQPNPKPIDRIDVGMGAIVSPDRSSFV